MGSSAQTSALGRVIQGALARKGRSQAWLAGKLGVSKNAVTKWIKTGKISRENVAGVSDALDVSPAELLSPSEATAGAAPRTPRHQRLIELFEKLTTAEQDDILSELEAKARHNDEVVRERGMQFRAVTEAPITLRETVEEAPLGPPPRPKRKGAPP